MNLNRNIPEVLKRLQAEAAFKRDQLVDLSTLRYEDGRLHDFLGFVPQYELTDWAKSQLCSKLGVPYEYFKRCPKELQAANVNDWLSRAGNAKMRLREEGGKTVIRGLVSEKYAAYDNEKIVANVDQFLDKLEKDYNIELLENDGDNLHMRLTFEDTTTDLGETPLGLRDIQKVGVHIQNSEVGRSSIRIVPFVYRLVCTNGLMAWERSGASFVQRHIHIQEHEMEERVAAAFTHAFDKGRETLDTLRKAKSIKAEDPFKLIDDLAKNEKFSKKFVEEAKTAYNLEHDGSLYYVIQAITDVAKQYGTERRIEIEEQAAKLLQEKVAV